MKKSELKRIIIAELRKLAEQDLTSSNPNAPSKSDIQNQIKTIPELQKMLRDLAISLPKIKGIDSNEIKGISSMLTTMLNKASHGSTTTAIKTTQDRFQSGTKSIQEALNPVDRITLDIPLFIRLLEYAKEDAQTDMDLHDVAERAIKLGSVEGVALSMDDYNALVQGEEVEEQGGISKRNVKKVKITVPNNDRLINLLNTTPAFSRLLPRGMKLKAGENIVDVNHYTYKEMMDKYPPRGVEVEELSSGKEVEEGKPGLWDNIRAKRARGEKPSHGNSKAFKDAVKAGKEINKNK